MKSNTGSSEPQQPRVIVAQLGARMHYAIPRMLHEAGMLERFYTDTYIGNKPWLEAALKAIPKLIRPQSISRWLGRKDIIIPSEKLVSSELIGFWYAWARSQARNHKDIEVVYCQASKYFGRFVENAGFGNANVVWAFDGAALEIFQAARTQGRLCVMEQTILPRQIKFELLRQELTRWPDWQPGLMIPENDLAMIEREAEEWNLADCIVAGSEFVRNGLEQCGVPATKVRVVPYGVDVKRFSPPDVHESETGEPLRVLFVGEVGLRKGVPDLLHALSKLGPYKVQARFAGKIVLDRKRLDSFADVAHFLGPLPRMQMPALYRWADIFVLPSIAEGSAAVTYEALLSGLPVVATPNTGSIVQDTVNGFIVPIRNSDALAEAIGRYYSDRTLLRDHQKKAIVSRSWASLDRYKQDIIQLIYGLQ